MRCLMLVVSGSGAAGRWRWSGLGCACALVLSPSLTQAQVAALPQTLVLKPSPKLEEAISAEARKRLPSFVSGHQITGRTDQETFVQGEAMLRKGDIVIKADKLSYDQPTDTAKAQGNVLVNRAGNVYQGPLLELKVDTFEGFFTSPRYQFLKNDAHGEASRVDFVDDHRAVIHNATFTTCQRLPGADWLPDWILKATKITMDNENDVGTAQGALLSFKGVPLLPIPYLSFPISDKRKSGFLPPTLGVDNVNGTEVSVPYYWNIAPNLDATLTPSVMTKRGINLGTEFRYLRASHAGSVRLDVMPVDSLRDRTRWGLNLTQHATIPSAWTDYGVATSLNLNRVSDDNYWRDFSRASTSLTQRLLANDAVLAWNNNRFSSSVRTLKWQTLQDASSPIVPPYDRLPQIATRYAYSTDDELNLSVDADFTRFSADETRTQQPNAQRFFSVAQLSQTWRRPGGYLTPKLSLHATSYQFDTPLSTHQTQVSRVVPTLSVDSGLVFERDARWFGRNLVQTLEPRAFYVNTPFRDQNFLPNYDSGANDFNLSSVYSENAFVGNDRISDSNLLTLGVTSRLLNPSTGAENARFGVAQRLRFRDQNVTLPGGSAANDRVSDVLIGGAVSWDPRWSFNTTVQFNMDTEQSVRSTMGARYSPGRYRTVSAAYRFQRNLSEQIDVSWQWPINDLWGDRGQNKAVGQGQGDGRWYSVGRLNFSKTDGKLVDSVLGLEYDGGCWISRVVLERLQTSSNSATQRLMFQLEFVGFSRLGVNPLRSLKANIPGYQNLREPSGTPSRFTRYD